MLGTVGSMIIPDEPALLLPISAKDLVEAAPKKIAKVIVDHMLITHSESPEVIGFCLLRLYYVHREQERALSIAEEAFSRLRHPLLLDLYCRFLTIAERFDEIVNLTERNFRDPVLSADAYLNHGSALLRLGCGLEVATGFFQRGATLGPYDPDNHAAAGLSVGPSTFQRMMDEFPVADIHGVKFLNDRPDACRHIFLASGDEHYAIAFLEIYTFSFFQTNPPAGTLLHFHLYDPTPEVFAIIDRIKSRTNSGSVNFSIEVTNGFKPYYYAGRLIHAPLFLQHYNCPIIITDIDFLFTGSVEPLLERASNLDMGYHRVRMYTHPWAHFRAGIVVFSSTPAGLKIAQGISAFLGQLPTQLINYWYVDQMAIATAFYSNKHRRIGKVEQITKEAEPMGLQTSGTTGEPKLKAARAREAAITRGIKL
jgi:hypothetical protein